MAANAVCLLLFAMTAVLGVRSLWYSDVFWSYRLGTVVSGRGTGEVGNYDDNTWLARVSRGAVAVGYENQRFGPPNPALRATLAARQGRHHATHSAFDLYDAINIPGFQGWGFKYGLTVYKAGTFTFGRQLIIPLWFVLLLLALPPTRMMLGRYFTLAQRRREMGLCAQCGYNLTGNTRGVCPECGTPAAPEHSVNSG